MVPRNTLTKAASGTKYKYILTWRGINGQIHVSAGRSDGGIIVLLLHLASEDGATYSNLIATT